METSARVGLVGKTVGGRYQVRSLLARGGMATVYEAIDLRLDRRVAFKVMHPHLAADPGFVARFEREAKSAARLSHPHVVGVYDQGEADGLVYLAMEFIPGRTLRDVIREYGPLTTEQALVLLEPVLEALSAAHAAGLVHRDIKPENVLISHDGRVKVADFGLARAVATSDTNTTAGVLIGTVAYLAPEQVERGDADARTDIYAAGVCLFEMITGRVPHAGESPLAVAYQHVNADVPAPSSIRAGIPEQADAIVRTATRRDPEQRYLTSVDFLADVHRARAALPTPVPFIDTPAMNDTLVVGTQDSWSATSRFDDPEQDLDQWDDHRTHHRKRRSGVSWLVATVVALAVASAGFAGWWLAAGPGTHVPTPDVLGQDFGQARAVMTQEGFTLTSGTEAYSETIPPGAVISTDPAPGEGLRPGGTVTAITSLGPERYPVPDVLGSAPNEAAEAILDAGLATGGRVEVFDNTIPAGQVARTDPAIGEAVAPNTSVDLLISKGPEPVELADVTGRRQANAVNRLQAAGLEVTTSQEFSSSVAEGRVISMNPGAGTVVEAGSTVSLVVSKGPPPVPVPDLIDMRRKAAVEALERAGLRANVDAGEFTRLNRVFDQSPSPGEMVPRGTTVTIRIV